MNRSNFTNYAAKQELKAINYKSSTETIFPPVFGHRLNAKIAKLGDRVLLDIEVSGTPNPTVTWYKDEKPIDTANLSTYKLLIQGNSHTLIIEKGISNYMIFI